MRRAIVMLVMGLGLGCGSGDPTGPYLGTWAEIGTVRAACSDGSSDVQNTSGQVVVTRGGDSDLLRSTTGGSTVCAVPLNIDGGRASLAYAVSCSARATDGSISTATVAAWTMTVIDGHSASESGSVVAVVTGGSCTFGYTIGLSR